MDDNEARAIVHALEEISKSFKEMNEHLSEIENSLATH